MKRGSRSLDSVGRAGGCLHKGKVLKRHVIDEHNIVFLCFLYFLLHAVCGIQQNVGGGGGRTPCTPSAGPTLVRE